jgi:outer membrane protein OmpA-like peptidoglycan-associated protein
MKHIIRLTTGTLVVGMIAAGCSTTPSQSDTAAANAALGSAGHAIDKAAADPHVTQYASSELGRAKDSLNKAQSTWNDKHDLTETKQLAYLAQQRAATAKELADERAAEHALTVAVAERDRAVKLAAARRHARPGATAQEALASFAFGKATLPADAMPKIDELATMLKNNPDRKIVIEGHTDNVGSPGYNKTLAMERAEAVRAALLQRGIDPSRIIVRSSGEANPVASNDTHAGRRENRRAEVILGEAGGQVATGGTSTGQSQQSGH